MRKAGMRAVQLMLMVVEGIEPHLGGHLLAPQGREMDTGSTGHGDHADGHHSDHDPTLSRRRLAQPDDDQDQDHHDHAAAAAAYPRAPSKAAAGGRGSPRTAAAAGRSPRTVKNPMAMPMTAELRASMLLEEEAAGVSKYSNPLHDVEAGSPGSSAAKTKKKRRM